MSASLLHRTRDGERWDQLAYRYYGDALAYGRLVEANQHLDIAAVLPGNVVLLVPVVVAPDVATPSSQLPPWKR